jgi:transcriptional regulator GlxA family with amidase domain
MQSTADCDLLEVFSGQRGHVLRDCKRLFSLASELERELSGTGYGRELLSGAALLRLLVRIGREQRREDLEPPKPVDPTNPRVLGLMRYMEEHLAEDLDVDALAEQFYVSKYHLSHEFSREVGVGVYRYLLLHRLSMARQLLADGASPGDVCLHCGFKDYTAFFRAFKAEYGISPRESVAE